MLKPGDCVLLFRRALYKLQQKGYLILQGDEVKLTKKGEEKIGKD